MEEVDIMYDLFDFLIDEKAENIKSDISKNQISFTKDGKNYTLKLTENKEN